MDEKQKIQGTIRKVQPKMSIIFGNWPILVKMTDTNQEHRPLKAVLMAF